MNGLSVAQSATRYCRVCDGHGVLNLVQLLGFKAVGRVNCPHCRPGRAAAAAVPAIPFRTDTPRSA